jgi:hypothetical protein
MKLKYIKTMDFLFEGIEVTNCNNIDELNNKIKENEVIEVNNDGAIECINSSYIMFFGV